MEFLMNSSVCNQAIKIERRGDQVAFKLIDDGNDTHKLLTFHCSHAAQIINRFAEFKRSRNVSQLVEVIKAVSQGNKSNFSVRYLTNKQIAKSNKEKKKEKKLELLLTGPRKEKTLKRMMKRVARLTKRLSKSGGNDYGQ